MSHMDCKYCRLAIDHTHGQHHDKTYRTSRLSLLTQQSIVAAIIVVVVVVAALMGVS